MKKTFVSYAEVLQSKLSSQEKDLLKKHTRLGHRTSEKIGYMDKTPAPQGYNYVMLGIASVEDNSPLDQAGLKRGDLLHKVNQATILVDVAGGICFLKDGEIHANVNDFVQEGQDFEIQYYVKVKSSRMGQMHPGVNLDDYDLRTAMVKYIPFFEVTDEKVFKKIQRAKIVNLPKNISQEIFGQSTVMDGIYPALKMHFAGLKDKDKPIGSYLFLGPTGTGKTELAKQIAKHLQFKLVRVDMSEFMESHTTSKLIGAPPSYIGYGEPTILEKNIKGDAKVVLLLDEMEKAHPDIQKVFLAAMDNSKVTMGNGNVVDFANTIIIMTSNLGVVTQKNMGLMAPEAMTEVDQAVVRRHFLPEFMGRLTATVEFKALDEDQIKKIMNKFVAEFNFKHLVPRSSKLVFTDKAVAYLMEKGYSKLYGARPMKNTLTKEVFEKVADLVLFQDELPKEIVVDYQGQIVLTAPTSTEQTVPGAF